MIISIIISAWLIKNISCSMTGEALFCSVRFNHVVIFLTKVLATLFVEINPIHLSATLEY